MSRLTYSLQASGTAHCTMLVENAESMLGDYDPNVTSYASDSREDTSL